MGKGKLAKFADMDSYENVFQYPFSVLQEHPFTMQGSWREEYFKNDNPIVLELGCGKGEYAVELARLYPQVNFIGVDIKGARMWTGATQVQQIWLTFSDPQMKSPRKRLTSTWFLERYRRFLVDGGTIHLKTDSNFLFTYTSYLVEHNHMPLLFRTDDLYHASGLDSETERILSIQTNYERMWMDRGLNIRYMKFQLPREGQLEEPDVEIPLDEYRSYKRDKRSPKETGK